jgi:hypothetical protein
MINRCHVALTVGIFGVMIAPSWSQPAMPHWQPDENAVRSIESSLVLPSLGQWSPGTLDSYARYYAGWTEKGHRIIGGDFRRGTSRHNNDKPGVYIVPFDKLMVATGGGCDHIVMDYDVDAHQVTHLACYGLG